MHVLSLRNLTCSSKVNLVWPLYTNTNLESIIAWFTWMSFPSSSYTYMSAKSLPNFSIFWHLTLTSLLCIRLVIRVSDYLYLSRSKAWSSGVNLARSFFFYFFSIASYPINLTDIVVSIPSIGITMFIVSASYTKCLFTLYSRPLKKSVNLGGNSFNFD